MEKTEAEKQLAASHEAVIDRMDQYIAQLEKQLEDAHTQRREYINRHNLNKVKPV